MSITVREISTKKDFKKFVDFPFQLYKNNKFWVPPIKDDELNALDATKNPAFNYFKTAFWLAEKDGIVVGRIGAIVNNIANERNHEQMCRFTRIEFVDDVEVTRALLNAAEAWAKAQGMIGTHGPLGFTNLDHQAVLIEGFEELPSIASEFHLPYYQQHLEACGYEKEMDWVEFRLKIAPEIPEKALRMNDLIKKRYNISVKHFETKEQMQPYGMKMFHLLNIAFADLFSFTKMPDDLLQFYIDKYINVLNPTFVKVIETAEGELIGFIISLPSLSEAMQKAKGSLFPFGFMHIMNALKKPKVLDLLLTAIHPEWQSQGVSALLITELQKEMNAHGVEYVETTGMIETNEKAINHWKNYDHRQHKRKRCYKKMF